MTSARRTGGWLRVAMVMAVAMAGVTAAGARADAASLYRGPAPRPGPDVLYAPPADAPQLQNAPGSPWQAPPILVSGAGAYRSGEYVYQGYLYDDHGAKLLSDPTNPMHAPGGNPGGGDVFSAPDGTYTYPTDARYGENAANLVELRVRPAPDATAFRLTLNTLHDPNLVASTIAIGGTPGVPRPFPHGANVSAPAQYFLTVHGTSAELLDALTMLPVSGGTPTASVDVTRRQITVTVPHGAWDPGRAVVRLAAGVGLWDPVGSYLTPRAQASATAPGGAGGVPAPAAFFDVAFRYNAQEPLPGAPGVSSTVDPAWWRERAQSNALTAHDISAFSANVDFGKLLAGTSDDLPGAPTGVPQNGAFDRIMASHYESAQGANYATGGCGSSVRCAGALSGQLQPYAIYIPAHAPPPGGFGLTLLLHSLSANYNQFSGTRNQSQFGDRGTGSIVITPSGRGPDGWYYDHAGADTFEVWADVAARYRLDPAYTAVAGYSMGGYGTYKFSTQFPDLFARAQPTVGPPGLGVWLPPGDPQPGGPQSNTFRMLASVRNLPFVIWVEATDQLVPYAGPLAQANALDALGYRYEFDTFAAGDHLTLAVNDQYAPAAAFLGSAAVDRNPPRVTYVYNPTMDFPAAGTAAGHAYWISGLSLRSAAGSAPLGRVDVRSEGFGTGDPSASGTQHGGGALTGGQLPAIPYTSQSRSWGAAPATGARDALDITARNLATVTINAARARVDCRAQLNVNSDGPLSVNLVSCSGGHSLTRSFGSGATACRGSRALVVHARRRRSTRVASVASVVIGGRRCTSPGARGRRRGHARQRPIHLTG